MTITQTVVTIGKVTVPCQEYARRDDGMVRIAYQLPGRHGPVEGRKWVSPSEITTRTLGTVSEAELDARDNDYRSDRMDQTL